MSVCKMSVLLHPHSRLNIRQFVRETWESGVSIRLVETETRCSQTSAANIDGKSCSQMHLSCPLEIGSLTTRVAISFTSKKEDTLHTQGHTSRCLFGMIQFKIMFFHQIT